MTTSAADKNLLITGYSGPGQQAIVRAVAARLHMPLLHFEALMENRAETSLDEFRLRFGETRLRTLEADVLGDVALARGSVLMMSGHVLAQTSSLDRMRASAIILCLVASLDAVLRRLHLAMGARYHNPSERERAVGVLRREWAVRGRPGVIEIDTTHLSDSAIQETVIAHWRELSGIVDMGRQ